MSACLLCTAGTVLCAILCEGVLPFSGYVRQWHVAMYYRQFLFLEALQHSKPHSMTDDVIYLKMYQILRWGLQIVTECNTFCVKNVRLCWFSIFDRFCRTKSCPGGSTENQRLHFRLELLREIAGLSVLQCLASRTPFTNVEDLNTLITVYSSCSCECLISEVSKMLPFVWHHYCKTFFEWNRIFKKVIILKKSVKRWTIISESCVGFVVIFCFIICIPMCLVFLISLVSFLSWRDVILFF